MENFKTIERGRKEGVSLNLIPPSEWICHYRNLLTEDRPKFITVNDHENYNLDLSLTVQNLITKKNKKGFQHYEKRTGSPAIRNPPYSF